MALKLLADNVVEGFPPSPDPKAWVSPEIPYEEGQLRQMLPRKPFNFAWATWFRKCTGQSTAFSLAEAAKTKPVHPAKLRVN